ncbi:MAG: phosphopantothenoylcysteine decarboxylase / phosphopantothenate---cysteine ligase [Abditibacteriota bacterium]|nr:phosphopantothenoylcysteine decarboxylase / phosphopantothenate---cysteine ligase [Abditibacteriota bacterium]
MSSPDTAHANSATPAITIVLGVSGSIAAYKACELASRLTQSGVTVEVVMTQSAHQFVAPLTFQALTHRPVHTSLWPESAASESGVYAAMAHIALADAASAVLIAPASANLLARLANGLADDLLTTIILATRAPILVAPAMNPVMWSHPATQKNIATLRELGYIVIEPEGGRMACEHVGAGRLPASETIIAKLNEVLLQQARRDLVGLKVLVTAGPTREPLDPVRYLSNRSSGRMGFALAEEAATRGAKVLLVAGPCPIATPRDVQRIDVQSALEMRDAVLQAWPRCDVLIGAAAPADFRAAEVASQKIKKRGGTGELELRLISNPDIVREAAAQKRQDQIVVAFAAETQNLLDEARRKMQDKGADAIVANDVSQADAGFDVETNRVTWLSTTQHEEWPLLSKREVASKIWDKVLGLRPATV